ncbi:MAG: STY4526/YPO1902 family pathogenicity island replication protein [Parvibaculaceae bacterium]
MADGADFQLDTLLFLNRCVRNGRTDVLEELGVDVDTMRLIHQIPAQGMVPPRRMPKIVRSLDIDLDALAEFSRQACHFQQAEDVIARLLQAGATQRLLNHFFGLTKQDVSNRRKLLNIESTVGRPATRQSTCRPDQDLVLLDLVGQHMRVHPLEERQSALHQCEALLRTAEYTDLSVAVVWETIEQAIVRGEFAWDG